MQNYNLLLKRISSQTGISEEEIEKKIEMKIAKLSGLISKEGAAQIVASELGVNFENIDLKIAELMPGMKKVNLLVKVVKIFPVRVFNKNGREGKVANLIVADDSGSGRVVLWDANHIKLVEDGEIKEEDTIEIKNASIRDSEIHLASFSNIKKSSLLINEVKINMAPIEKKILELKQGDNVKLRGTAVQIFPPRFFFVCPECKRKVVKTEEGFFCDKHGKINPTERSLISFVLDDGTDNIRVILFSENLSKIADEEELKNEEGFNRFKENFLGEELEISGFVKKNILSGSLEVSSNTIGFLDLDKILS
ncbi:MAG: hypothetical protein QXX68_02120 [Candidatus Pacearchaeota archaeon]